MEYENTPAGPGLDAVQILHQEFAWDEEFQQILAEERIKSSAARAIYQARKDAGLTQAELGRLVGTTQSVISRMEDSDYDRHTLLMMERIARALNRNLEVRLSPKKSTSAESDMVEAR